MPCESGQYLVTAHNGAQCVCTYADVIVPGRGAPVHRVEGRHCGHLGIGEAELFCTEGDSGTRDEPFDALHQMQQGQQCGPGLWIALDDTARLVAQTGLHRGRERYRASRQFQGNGGRPVRCGLHRFGGHRSTPPITGSMLATEAITSATMPPSHIAATACRFVNDGSRKCTR